MQFTTAAITSILATLAAARPAGEVDSAVSTVSMMVASSSWTVQSMKRVCDSADTSCAWSFKINTGAAATDCAFTAKGSPASQTNQNSAVQCGDFAVTTGWSGQFGAGNGFTTLAVVDSATKQIIYPAYTDKQLTGGNVVSPDQSYTPAALP
jgi:hypothetical protein